MKRPIVFRGKRIDNGEWVYGFLIGSLDPTKAEDSYRAWFIHTGVSIAPPIRVIPETVGQYAGLNDKHGKPIYEGDIITCDIYERENFDEANSGSPIKVSYDENVGGFYPLCKGSQWRSGCENIEIIGNVHEKQK